MPFVFYTNGHESYFWEHEFYPPTRIHGFASRDDLEWMDERRRARQPLSRELIDTRIVEREYQIAAMVRRNEDAFAAVRDSIIEQIEELPLTVNVVAKESYTRTGFEEYSSRAKSMSCWDLRGDWWPEQQRGNDSCKWGNKALTLPCYDSDYPKGRRQWRLALTRIPRGSELLGRADGRDTGHR